MVEVLADCKQLSNVHYFQSSFCESALSRSSLLGGVSCCSSTIRRATLNTIGSNAHWTVQSGSRVFERSLVTGHISFSQRVTRRGRAIHVASVGC